MATATAPFLAPLFLASCSTSRIKKIFGIPAFVQLGSMYQVGNVIWSGAVKKEKQRGIFNRRVDLVVKKMNLLDADQYCRNLGGGARLPTWKEYEDLVIAMGRLNYYNRNAIPDMAGN